MEVTRASAVEIGAVAVRAALVNRCQVAKTAAQVGVNIDAEFLEILGYDQADTVLLGYIREVPELLVHVGIVCVG